MMSNDGPVNLTSEELESAKEENSTIVVDFWAEWCGPCKMMEPIMESLAESHGDEVLVGKINVDNERQAAMEYNVSSIPTILFFQDGEIVDKVIGAIPEEKLKQKVDEMTG